MRRVPLRFENCVNHFGELVSLISASDDFLNLISCYTFDILEFDALCFACFDFLILTR